MKWFLGIIDFVGQINTPNIYKYVNEYFGNQKLEYLVENFTFASLSVVNLKFNKERDNKFVFKFKDLILIGDIRIDNRDELLPLFKSNEELAAMQDEILILYLFDKLGTAFVEKIVGEFSFIIIHQQDKTVYAFRDQLGIKTLFWGIQGSKIWIATDIFLLQSIFDYSDINYEYFIDYYNTNGNVDSEITPYININRIPSGHFLSVVNQKFRVNKYWDLSEVEGNVRYRNLTEYQEKFIDIFKKSVSSRIKPNTINSVMMSGGLDSTSVYAVAKKNNSDANTFINAVCGVFDKFNECDEREFITPLIQLYNEKPIFEVCDEYGILKDFPNDCPWTDEPNVNSISYRFTKSLTDKAKIYGATNVLFGYAGDHVLSGTSLSIHDSVRKFKLGKAIKDVYKLSLETRMSFGKYLLHEAIYPFWGGGWIQDIKKKYNCSVIKQLDKIGSYNQKDFYIQLQGTKSRIFLDRTIAPSVGVICQHPFLDRRLIEYLYKIPGELRWSNGETKYILRQSLKDYIPEIILNRKNKTEHLALTYHGLRENWTKIYPILRRTRIKKLGLVTEKNWANELIAWRQGGEVREDMWILLAIEIWLYRLEEKLKKNKLQI